jgi:hypothetical protein
MGGDLGGDMGADLGADMDAEMPAEMPAADAGDESALLAVPPGSRNAPRTYGRGEVYHPAKRDDRKSSGPRTRSLNSKHSKAKSSSGPQNVFPGSEINKIPSISKGIYEEKPSIYKLREQTEEFKLFEVNDSIRQLLNGLENNKPTEQEDEDKTQQEA